jgi:hypothetical protein
LHLLCQKLRIPYVAPVTIPMLRRNASYLVPRLARAVVIETTLPK